MDSAALRDTANRKSSGSDDQAPPAGRARAGQSKKGSAKGSVRNADDDTTTQELLPVSVPSGTSDIKIQATTVVHSSGRKTAKFNISTDATHAYGGGVTLIFEKPDQVATIYWYLDKGISSLSSSSPYLQFAAASGGQQSMSTEAHTYKALSIPFLVNFVSGETHDPIIIVTPIGGGPPPHLPGDPLSKRSGAKGKAGKGGTASKGAVAAKGSAASKGAAAGKGKTGKSAAMGKNQAPAKAAKRTPAKRTKR